MVRQ
ncbi:terminase large subunit from bacteriophage origin, partial [Escherichia coli 07798]